MNETEQYIKHRKVDLWKLLSQWVFLPVITFLLGCTGTYVGEVKDIREKQLTQGKDIESISKDMGVMHTQTDDRIKNVAMLLEATIKQNTEVIALVKIQQQQLIK